MPPPVLHPRRAGKGRLLLLLLLVRCRQQAAPFWLQQCPFSGCCGGASKPQPARKPAQPQQSPQPQRRSRSPQPGRPSQPSCSQSPSKSPCSASRDSSCSPAQGNVKLEAEPEKMETRQRSRSPLLQKPQADSQLADVLKSLERFRAWQLRLVRRMAQEILTALDA